MPNSVLNVFIKLHALIRFRFFPVLIECLAVFLDELNWHFLVTDLSAMPDVTEIDGRVGSKCDLIVAAVVQDDRAFLDD